MYFLLTNQVWSWDITYCSTEIREQYYYLYMMEDIFSRKIVGWEVYEEEGGEHSASLLQRTVMREQDFKKPLVLHSDNGAPMKSPILKSKMEEFNVTGSHSGPSVSNDNPYSESLFRTMKYCPQWPSQGFKVLEAVRNWVKEFVSWYNDEHCHSRISVVTPSQRHQGVDKDILINKKKPTNKRSKRTRIGGQDRSGIGSILRKWR